MLLGQPFIWSYGYVYTGGLEHDFILVEVNECLNTLP